MSIVVETKYEGKYKSGIKTPLSEEPIAVNAARFNPVDLLAGAYGSCLLGTIDYECRKNSFPKTTEARTLTETNICFQRVTPIPFLSI